MKTIISKLVLIITFIAVFVSCKTTTRLSDRNLNFLYEDKDIRLNPQYKIFHHKADSSTIYFKVSSDELLYVSEDEEQPPQANFKIKYKLFDSFRSRVVADSSTTYFSHTIINNSGKWIYDSITAGIPHDSKYIVHLTMTDINSESEVTRLVNINKTGDNNLQYYKIFDTNGLLLFSPIISQKTKLVVKYTDAILKDVDISIYKTSQPAALPPFLDYTPSYPEIEPDTVFQISYENGIAELNIDIKGVYRIHNGSDVKQGASLYCFYDGFPKIRDTGHMLYPLRYITTGEEFEKLIQHPDPVDAVDIFWTTMAGTPLRGRYVIDNYYSNLAISNKLFTSWKEGWKTDRGMIYTVLGKPDYVVRDDDSEKWIYRDKWEVPETIYEFRKIDTPIGETCFQLIRRNEYRNIWFHAVERIRR